MKTANSAGGIIVCPFHNQWYVLILKDMNASWTFPKGLIEKGESPQDAAAREINEEVGIGGLKLLTPLPPISYFFQRNGLISKTVQYFVFTSKTRVRPKPQKEEGISAARWVLIEDAIGMIGYRETNVRLLEETWKFVKHRT